MLRFLIKFLLLSIIAVVSLMLLAQWRLDEKLQSFTRQLDPIVDIRYESAEISYTGEIKVNSIVAYFDDVNVSVEIGEIRMSVGNLLDLALFEANYQNQEIPKKAYLIVKDLLLPFNANLLKNFEQMQPATPLDVIQTAYCGDVERFGINEYEGMGYHYLASDSEFYYMLDQYSGSVVINGHADVEDAFRLEYQINIGSVLSWLENQKDRAVGQVRANDIFPDLSLLEIRHIDKGFNERKARLCALKEGVSVEEYYTGHQQAVTKIFEEVGMTTSESFNQLYPLSIKPNSEVYWFLQPKANFEFSGITYYDYQEFKDLSGLRLSVNKQSLELFDDGWSLDKFNQIIVNENERNRASDPVFDMYETVVVVREFRKMESTEASKYVGLKARVTRNDGKRFEGKITKSNDKDVWLLIRNPTGEITIPVKHSEVDSFEVYLKVD